MPVRADYAADPAKSRGRRFPATRSATRSEFQRDRDRIVHCTAFRRLEYKTQVFVNHEGDLFRTRLTHSIEVAQIARSAARCLRLDEDLVEAIALAHDLGHTPFGHAGQDELDACMKPWGGFEHNLQSLRVVDELEQRYAGHDGLNLCFETREGILKHCSPANARTLGELGERFLLRRQPSLEAQVANLADEIAYNNHDIDDGLRSGLLQLDAMIGVRLFGRHCAAARNAHPQVSGRRLVHETIRRMIDELVTDLIGETQRCIDAAGVHSIDAVRAAPALVRFSDCIRADSVELKRFLHANLYEHERVLAVMKRARAIVCELFHRYRGDPALLPDEHRQRVDAIGERAIADYIAGMTDRFAVREHLRLTGGDPDRLRAVDVLGAASDALP
ncbi:MAG: deoxyguanosinetriphosphate triphosphohydrolase [Burkholderiaceae bacterium]|nr:deoxyguanosinetriphosphate triphosphohydrolase [Burkholderiaceae bacterium]